MCNCDLVEINTDIKMELKLLRHQRDKTKQTRPLTREQKRSLRTIDGRNCAQTFTLYIDKETQQQKSERILVCSDQQTLNINVSRV